MVKTCSYCWNDGLNGPTSGYGRMVVFVYVHWIVRVEGGWSFFDLWQWSSEQSAPPQPAISYGWQKSVLTFNQNKYVYFNGGLGHLGERMPSYVYSLFICQQSTDQSIRERALWKLYSEQSIRERDPLKAVFRTIHSWESPLKAVSEQSIRDVFGRN